MDCFNKFLWAYLVLWEEPDCQNAGVTLSVAAEPVRTAWKWLNELWTSDVCLCKRAGSFIAQSFKELIYYVCLLLFIELPSTSRCEDVCYCELTTVGLKFANTEGRAV